MNNLTRMQDPSHPGQILAHFLDGHSVTEVAAHLDVPCSHLEQILDGSLAISADMALRLAEAFKTEPELWLRLQMQFDLGQAVKSPRPAIKPIEFKEGHTIAA